MMIRHRNQSFGDSLFVVVCFGHVPADVYVQACTHHTFSGVALHIMNEGMMHMFDFVSKFISDPPYHPHTSLWCCTRYKHQDVANPTTETSAIFGVAPLLSASICQNGALISYPFAFLSSSRLLHWCGYN